MKAEERNAFCLILDFKSVDYKFICFDSFQLWLYQWLV